MRPTGTTQQLEQRRRKAMALLAAGHGVRETARLVDASPGSVTTWRKAYEQHGEAALTAHSPPGRTPQLSDQQTQRLEQLLLQGARRHGYASELWTLQPVAALLEHFPKGIILVWDRWSVHRSAARRLAQRFSRRVSIEWLPAYVPELNPDEQVWNRTKYTDLANFIPEDVGQLSRSVRKSLRRTRTQQILLRSFFKHAKLKL